MKRALQGILLLLGPLVVVGCVSPDGDTDSLDRAAAIPESPSRGERPAPDAAAARDVVDDHEDATSSSGDPLSVDEAVRLALGASPRAEAARQRVAAESARAGAEGAFPEPVLSAGVEALPFDSPREEEEWLVGLSLALPAPGERAAERDVARARGATADAALRRTLLEVDAATRAAFAEAFFAVEAQTLAEYAAALADERIELVEAEVETGAAAPLDLLDVREEQVRARHARDASRREAVAARARLELLLPSPAHGRPLSGDVTAALALPELEALLARMEGLPQLAESAAEARLEALRAELADARRIPRVELAVAWRERADGRASLDAGFGIALPFGGRRTAEASAASRDAAAAGALVRARWREVREELLAAHAEARSAQAELHMLRESLLPLARQRVTRAKSLVEVGTASYGTVLEARAREAALAAEALTASLRMHAAWARLQPLLLANG